MLLDSGCVLAKRFCRVLEIVVIRKFYTHGIPHAYYAWKASRPGAEFWSTDVCVPISRLAECITETQKDIVASFLPLSKSKTRGVR
ncbi:MAG TPA: hypothetical protein VNU22_03310 [Candidatus Acidoferrum sp.]|nr:hypothetical protein [Candidatus Acidoferrum sp.]